MSLDGAIHFPRGVALDADAHSGTYVWLRLAFLAVVVILLSFVLLVHLVAATGFALSMGLFAAVVWRIAEDHAKKSRIDRPDQTWRITPTALELHDGDYHERLIIPRFHRYWKVNNSLYLVSRGTLYTVAGNRLSVEQWQRLADWVHAQVPPTEARFRELLPPLSNPVDGTEAGVQPDAVIGRGDLTKWERDQLGGMTIRTRLAWMLILFAFNLTVGAVTQSLVGSDTGTGLMLQQGMVFAMLVQWALVWFSYCFQPPPDPTSQTAVEPAGIVYCQSFGWSRIGWSQISAVRRVRLGFVLVSEPRGLMYPILRRTFSSEEDWQRVELIVREYTKLETDGKFGEE